MKVLLSLILFISFSNLNAQKEDPYKKFVDSVLLVVDEQDISKFLEKKIKSKPNDEELLRACGFLALEFDKLDEAEKYLTKALKINPKTARSYFNLAKIYALKNDGKKALEFSEKSISLNQTEATFFELRSKIKWMLKDLSGAMSDIELAISLDPKNVDFYLVKSDMNLFKKMNFLAIKELNKALKINDTLAIIYHKRSLINSQDNLLNEALEDANMAVKFEPEDLTYRNARAEIFFKLNDFPSAIQEYNYITEKEPENASAYYYRAYSFFKLENMDEFCREMHVCYDKIYADSTMVDLKKEIEQSFKSYCDSTNASYYYQRGVAFYNLGEFNKAVDIYSQGLKMFPDNSMLYSFRGNAQMAVSAYEKAIEDYQISIAKKENLVVDMKLNNMQAKMMSKESEETYLKMFVATMYLSIAEAKFALRQFDEAILEANKAIAGAPNVPEFPLQSYYFLRGNIYVALGKLHEALNDYEKCLQLNPNLPEVYAYAALTKMNMNNGKTLNFTLQGTTLNQEKSLTWILPVKYKINKELAQEALLDIEKALVLNPDYGFAYYLRAILKRYYGKVDYCPDFQKAKQLNYSVELNYLQECK